MTDVSSAGKHQTQSIGVVRPDSIQRPARLLSIIVKVRWIVIVIGGFRIKRMGNHEVHSIDLMLVDEPLHLRIGKILIIAPEDLAHCDVILLIVNVRSRAGQLR